MHSPPACRRLRKLGQRIGIAWLGYTCGQCKFCKTGRENLCPNSRYTGYHYDGGYAEYTCVAENFAYELPEHTDDAHLAPLLCAGIIGYRSFKRCNLRPGSKLALIGFGSSAHIILQIARHRGHEIYVVSRNSSHQKLSLELGAAWAGSGCRQTPDQNGRRHSFLAPAGPLVLPRSGSCSTMAASCWRAFICRQSPQWITANTSMANVTYIRLSPTHARDGHELLAAAENKRTTPHHSVSII